MKIYTRTGDNGTTSLFSGERVRKNDPMIEAMGAVDEGNSALGAALAFLPNEIVYNVIRQQLETVQHALFDVGAALATPRTCNSAPKINKTRFDNHATSHLEQWMDEMEKTLPPLHTFILPGGHPVGAHLHIARSIIRRAERLTIDLFEKGAVDQAVLIYLNRLSDYLFMASRHVNHLLGVPETPWHPHLC